MNKSSFTRKLILKTISSLILGLITILIIQAKKIEKITLSPNFGNLLGRNIDNVDDKPDSGLVLDNIAGGVYIDVGRKIFVAPDNQIFICGYSFNGKNVDPIIINVDTNGRFNSNFGDNGILVIDKVDDIHLFDSESIYVRDQKIYLIGDYWKSKGFVARFNYEGKLDNSFGKNGIVKIENKDKKEEIVSLREIYVDKNHNVFVIGNFHEYKNVDSKKQEYNINSFLLKLDQNGNFDKSFGSNGFLFLQTPLKKALLSNLVFDNQQKILLSGSGENSKTKEDVFIIKLNQNGTFDTTFANKGKIIFDYKNQPDACSDIYVDKNNNLYVAIDTGQDYRDIIVLKYNHKGYPDSSFGKKGMVIIDKVLGEKKDKFVNSMKVDSKGRIYLAGAILKANIDTQLMVVRINNKGQIDTSFGKNGFILVDNIAGGKYSDVATSIDLDKNFDIFITGYSTGRIHPNIPKQNTDFIVLKIENI
ncbi:MAG: hypothetical protein ABDH21_02355 [bacterium]